MAIGPGKYDDVCTMARQMTNARGAIVIIIGGERGEGFAVQGDLTITAALPAILERVAATIRADLKGGGHA